MDRRNFLKLLAAAGAVAAIPAAQVVFPESPPGVPLVHTGFYRAYGCHIQWGVADAAGRIVLPTQFGQDANLVGVFVTGNGPGVATVSGLCRDSFYLHPDGGSRYQWMAVAHDPYALPPA